MTAKTDRKTISDQIKLELMRNQRWLAKKIGMRESLLSEKINMVKEWEQGDLDKINKVLGTCYKL